MAQQPRPADLWLEKYTNNETNAKQLFNNNNIVRRCVRVCMCVRACVKERDSTVDHRDHDNFTTHLPHSPTQLSVSIICMKFFSCCTDLSETFNYAHKTKSLTLFIHLPRYTYNAYTRSRYEIYMNVNPMLTTFITYYSS